MIVNCSFGLGEAIVSGRVTPDTYIVDRDTLTAKETMIGAKEQMIVSNGEQGTRMENVTAEQKEISSLSKESLTELAALAISVEKEFDGVPQDIEWAISDAKLWLLQSRPITNLPPEPLRNVIWPEIPGAQLLKRQVAENMPDPLCPLFEDIYLRAIFDTQSWPEGWKWNGRLTKNWMKNFVVTTVNGYAYQPLYNERHGDWENHMSKIRKEQVNLPWYANFKQAIRMPSFMIDEMKGGPLHVFLFTDAYVPHIQEVSCHQEMGKTATPGLPRSYRTLAENRPDPGYRGGVACRYEVTQFCRGPGTGMPCARL